MGNCLDLPRLPEGARTNAQSAVEGGSGQHVQRNSPVILPFNNFTGQTDGIETPRQSEGSRYGEQNNNIEIETLRMDNSFISGNTSVYSLGSKATAHKRYIKRYRNEEEKLLDMLQEREKLLKSAIQQGQQLRAKCSRYKEELDNVKEIMRQDLNENQWKKKYFEIDRKYRDIKEEVDVMVARNRNGRDFLRQQQESIDSLNIDLQREKIERQRLLSSSLSSLHSTGIVDKGKGKLLITQLQVDNSLLQNRVEELTKRNARGRDYLSRIEAEKREQAVIIRQLKEKLSSETEEKERLLSRLGMELSSGKPTANTEGSEAKRVSAFSEQDLYATVQKSQYQTMAFGEEASTGGKSTGFGIDDEIRPIEPERQYNVLSGVYDEVELLPLEIQDESGKDDSLNHESSTSIEEKSVNELNAEAIIKQIHPDTEETHKDISPFTPLDSDEEENGIPNEELNGEESLTKF